MTNTAIAAKTNAISYEEDALLCILSGNHFGDHAGTKELDTILKHSQMPEKSRVFGDKGCTGAHNREVDRAE